MMVFALMVAQVNGQGVKLNTLGVGAPGDSTYLLGAGNLGSGQGGAKMFNLAAIADYVAGIFAPSLTFDGVLAAGAETNLGFTIGKVSSVHPHRQFQVLMLSDSSALCVMADTGSTAQIVMGTDTGLAYIDMSGAKGSYVAVATVNATGAVNTPSVTVTSNVALADGVNVSVGTSTGTVFGTSTSQKIAFYGGTPRVQQSGDLIIAFDNLGLGSANTLNTNDLTQGPVEVAVAGSTSGAAYFTQPFIALRYKKVMIRLNNLVGTASWTFATAFTNTPVVLSTTGLATSVVTSLSQTTVTVTGSTTSGILIVEGY
jgi:hypothetical protein